jgi:hypothetical protein
MRAISLWQPWASLWLTAAKVHETRHWPTRHKGPLLVHAAKRKLDDYDGDDLDLICVRLFGPDYRATLPRGALLGIVHITACGPTRKDFADADRAEHADDRACGDWSEGRFAWRRGSFRTFPPIAFPGRQGIFEVSDEVIAITSATKERP